MELRLIQSVQVDRLKFKETLVGIKPEYGDLRGKQPLFLRFFVGSPAFSFFTVKITNPPKTVTITSVFNGS
jgi:hypothetical protein